MRLAALAAEVLVKILADMFIRELAVVEMDMEVKVVLEQPLMFKPEPMVLDIFSTILLLILLAAVEVLVVLGNTIRRSLVERHMAVRAVNLHPTAAEVAVEMVVAEVAEMAEMVLCISASIFKEV
mgnify:CR=1 FL=1